MTKWVPFFLSFCIFILGVILARVNEQDGKGSEEKNRDHLLSHNSSSLELHLSQFVYPKSFNVHGSIRIYR